LAPPTSDGHVTTVKVSAVSLTVLAALPAYEYSYFIGYSLRINVTWAAFYTNNQTRAVVD